MKRNTIAVLKKSELCACGCRGWCTIYHFFKELHWELCALAEGIHPTNRHDRADWAEAAHKRRDLAGKPMGIKAALLFLKGDWAEFAATFGFPSWGDLLRPCFCCNMFGICVIF